MTIKWLIRLILCGFVLLTQTAFAEEGQNNKATGNDIPLLSIYKSPTCGCCSGWVTHVQEGGFATMVTNQDDLTDLKAARGIEPRYQSCHTAISKDGYVFEGHVPAKFIHQFLKEKPANALGLSVPAMPVGTPGMEMGDKFHRYQVLMLMKDGSSRVYATVNTMAEQY